MAADPIKDKPVENIFRITDEIVYQLNKTKKMVILMIVSIVIVLPATHIISFALIGDTDFEGSDEGLPQINGSVSIANETSNFVNENVKVSFLAAAQTAQGQVTNGTVLGGHLGILQGYLVYTFFVADMDNQTGHLVVVDAGNSNVLFTSEGQSIGSFGHQMPFGLWGGHGHGGIGQWHGPGKPHWFGGGMWN